MRILDLGLRVSDLEQSIAFHTALRYAELGRGPETEFGSLTMISPSDLVGLRSTHILATLDNAAADSDRRTRSADTSRVRRYVLVAADDRS